MPNLQRGGPCLNFAHFSMQFCNPGDPKGGPWPNAAPQNTPLGGVPKDVLGLEDTFEVLGLEDQVLGLGLEVSSPISARPRLEDSTIF